jgi:putative ABC transport system substrate-binding protein
VDPVKYSFVASFNRPGGNVTGMSLLGAELAGNRLSLLLQLASQATTVGYLAAHASAPTFEDQKSRMLDAAKGLAREVVIWQAGRPSDLDVTFAIFAARSVGALVVGDFKSLSVSRMPP